jgi:EpsI family protein
MKSAKFWVVFVLLAATFSALRLRGDTDRVPATPPLSLLPQTIGTRTAQDYPLDSETLEVLGDGRFLNRVYSSVGPVGQPAEAPVSLFIGYFPTQRSGQSIHSPQNCLPGAGWAFLSSQVINLPTADGRPYPVGEYLIGNAGQKQVVLYWYLAHGRSVASDYLAKAYMMLEPDGRCSCADCHAGGPERIAGVCAAACGAICRSGHSASAPVYSKLIVRLKLFSSVHTSSPPRTRRGGMARRYWLFA